MTILNNPRKRSRSNHHNNEEAPADLVAVYERFLPRALAIPDREVRVARENIGLARLNASRGAAIVLAHADEIAKLPGVSLAQLGELEDLGLAVEYAAGCVRWGSSIADTDALIESARVTRAKLRAKASVLVPFGIAPADLVRRTREGRGALRLANECIGLARLLRDHAAAAAAHVSIHPDELQAADDIGRRLLTTLAPPTARSAPDPERAAAADIRDRMWTLLATTWQDNVWRAGAYLFGPAVRTRLPGLRTARVRRGARAPAGDHTTVTAPTTVGPMPPP